MKLIRVTIVPMTMNSFCKGLLRILCERDGYGYEVVARECQERAKQFDISVMAEKYNEEYKLIISN